MKAPSLPAVMLFVIGAFQITAAFGCLVPSFVHDRVPQQFVPVWAFLTSPFYGEESRHSLLHALAVASQFIIGIAEAITGVLLLGAAFIPARRQTLASCGLALAAGLYGAFMVTMFAMHDKNLPKWNQYPAILAWIGITWLVVSLVERPRTNPARS